MHLRAKVIALAILIGPLPRIAPAADAVTSAAPGQAAPSQTALDAAVADLRQDPNLGGRTKVRTLRWVGKSRPTPPPTSPSWLPGLFEYFGQFAGWLLWAGGAGAAAVAVVWIVRLLKARVPRAVPDQPKVADRRVLDLGIDPDTLPDDVGAAALELLRDSRVRDCLSLLYRASLSSAVRGFGVNIGAQLTEREVLGVIKGVLDEPRARYLSDLVSMRQRVVYAGEAVAPDMIQPLCARFPTFFDPPKR